MEERVLLCDADDKEWEEGGGVSEPRSEPTNLTDRLLTSPPPRRADGHYAVAKMATRALPAVVMVGGLFLLGVCLGDLRGAATDSLGVTEDATLNPEDLNLYPIIGILSQELSRSMDNALDPHNYTSYIAASYVKFYESAGARVVPILINQDDEYYRSMAASINGMVFPGGSASITNSSGYGRAGDLMYELLQERDPPVPLMATCLGFEMQMYLAGNRSYPLTSCAASNRADPLYLTPEWEESRLLGEAPADVLETFTSTNATSNFHKYCVLPQTFNSLGIHNDYRLLSTSVDDDGVEYVSTVEHKTLPFYGTQWHPEKNSYEWKFSSIPHTRAAIHAAQYVANHFIEQARANPQTFPTTEEEEAALIYNYSPTYTANLYSSSSFQQCYFFE